MPKYVVGIDTIDIAEPITAGDDYTFTLTLARDENAAATLDGTLTSSTVSLRNEEAKLLTDVALTITDANNRIATLAFTAVQTALLDTVANHEKGVIHLADIKNVETGGSVVTYGPLKFHVKRRIT